MCIRDSFQGQQGRLAVFGIFQRLPVHFDAACKNGYSGAYLLLFCQQRLPVLFFFCRFQTGSALKLFLQHLYPPLQGVCPGFFPSECRNGRFQVFLKPFPLSFEPGDLLFRLASPLELQTLCQLFRRCLAAFQTARQACLCLLYTSSLR